MLTLGIDDAGRGPIIGPMILAGVLLDEDIELEFKKLGVKDSKQLTPSKRENLANLIREKALTFEITITHPFEIDGKTRDGINLNSIEAIKTAEIINRINKAQANMKVVVDCPSPNIPKWQAYLINHIKNTNNLNILCEHKADVNHIAVSAASILAKSTREKEVQLIKDRIGKDFGSGYTSDPITIKFLEEYSQEHQKDGIFRETWITWKKNEAKNKQKNLLDF